MRPPLAPGRTRSGHSGACGTIAHSPFGLPPFFHGIRPHLSGDGPYGTRVSLWEHIELWVPIVKVFDPLYTYFRKSLSHGYSGRLYIHTHRFEVCTEKAQRPVPSTESPPSHRARFLGGVTFRAYVHFHPSDKLVVANSTTYRHEVANATCSSERYNIKPKLVVAKN